MIARIWVLILLIYLPLAAINAQPLDLYVKKVSVYEDRNDSLSFQNIRNVLFSPPSKIPQVQSPKYAYWLKIDMQATAEILYLKFPYHFSSVTYYCESNGKAEVQSGGFNVPLDKRAVRNRDILFKINPHPNEFTIYVKLKSGFHNKFDFWVEPSENIIRDTTWLYYMQGIFLGFLLLVILYSSILYLVLREKLYFYYTIYVCSFLAYAFVDFGYLTQYFYSANYLFSYPFYTIPFASMIIFLMLYGIFYLKIDESSLYQVIRGAILLRLVILFLGFKPGMEILMHPLIDAVLILFLNCISIYKYKKGYLPAFYLAIPLSIMVIGLTFHSLVYEGIVISWMPTNNIIYYTGLIDVLLFGLSLGARYKFLKIEKEKLYSQSLIQIKDQETFKEKLEKDLEEKISQRTIELETIQLEMQKVNEKLQQSNLDLKSQFHQMAGARVLQLKPTFQEFTLKFPDDESCLKFLEDLKKDSGYVCRKCGERDEVKSTIPHSRRCKNCQYVESATVGTIFENLRFPLTKAFSMLFLINENQKVTIEELQKVSGLSYKTCWLFKKKVNDIYNSTGKKAGASWKELIFLN